MTTNSQGYAFVEANRPISYAKVNNGAGYLDLAIHKTKNGKAIRIVNKDGQKVCVSLAALKDFVAKATEVAAKGAATSTNVLPFGA